MIHKMAAASEADSLAPGIDQIKILPGPVNYRARSDNAVFGMDNDFVRSGEIVPHQLGHSNPQIDHCTGKNVLRDAPCHLFPRNRMLLRHFVSFLRLTTLWTKTPEVTMLSGSSMPRGTTSSTSTMVVFAAMHMAGPKLRAVMRYCRLPHRSARRALINEKSPVSAGSKT